MKEFLIGILRSFGISAIIICVVLAILFKIRNGYTHELSERLMSQMHRTYFCGYPTSEVYLDDFFQRYQSFVGHGFCWAVAALTMLCLRHEPTARIVDAFVRDKRGQVYAHAWVEFRYHGMWWIVDPCWCTPFMVPRWRSLRLRHVEIRDICTYERFWNYPISREFYAKLRNPETSYLFREIWIIYSHYDSRSESFHPQISDLRLNHGVGTAQDYEQNPFQAKDIPFSKQIMDEYMRKPPRLRPKARSIRRANASCKAPRPAQSL